MDRTRHLECSDHGWGLYYPICALDLGWPYVAGQGVVGRRDFALAIEAGEACQFCQEIYERKRLMPALDVEKYDPETDTIVIEGTRYSGYFFRKLGISFPNSVGQVLRIDKKEGDIVTVTRLQELEGK